MVWCCPYRTPLDMISPTASKHTTHSRTRGSVNRVRYEGMCLNLVDFPSFHRAIGLTRIVDDCNLSCPSATHCELRKDDCSIAADISSNGRVCYRSARQHSGRHSRRSEER